MQFAITQTFSHPAHTLQLDENGNKAKRTLSFSTIPIWYQVVSQVQVSRDQTKLNSALSHHYKCSAKSIKSDFKSDFLFVLSQITQRASSCKNKLLRSENIYKPVFESVYYNQYVLSALTYLLIPNVKVSHIPHITGYQFDTNFKIFDMFSNMVIPFPAFFNNYPSDFHCKCRHHRNNPILCNKSKYSIIFQRWLSTSLFM